MASGFPGSIDNFTDPLSNSSLSSPSHAGQHSDLNDAIEKIETYMGLVKVIPTSVSSAGGTAATLATNGTITIGTSNTSVTVNGAFVGYDNYRIVISGVTASVASDYSFQLSGITTSVYQTFGYFMTPGTATMNAYAPAAATQWLIGSQNTVRFAAVFDVIGPALAQQKFFICPAGLSTTGFYSFSGSCTSTAAATGFTITANTGNHTGGTIRVYGYRN